MAKLQKYQREYAMQRVRSAFYKRINDLHDKQENPLYSELDIVNMIITGKISMHSQRYMRDHANKRTLSHRHDIPMANLIFDIPANIVKAGKDFTKQKEALEKEMQEVLDKIMLMDSEETLSLISQYS